MSEALFPASEAMFVCPDCGEEYDDDPRFEAWTAWSEERTVFDRVTPYAPYAHRTIPAVRERGLVWPCCYENPACPEHCDEDHDAPIRPDQPGWQARFGNTWRCPWSGSEYAWCDACDEWAESRYLNPQHIGGEWLCDPSEHDYYSCDDCGGWVYSDDTYGDDDGNVYCRDCRSERQRDHGYDDDDEPGRDAAAKRCANDTGRCIAHVIFDEDSERWYCHTHHPNAKIRAMAAVAA